MGTTEIEKKPNEKKFPLLFDSTLSFDIPFELVVCLHLQLLSKTWEISPSCCIFVSLWKREKMKKKKKN